MLAETAKLAIELNLTGNAKAGIVGVQRQLTGLNRQSGQIGAGFKTMGAGVGVAFRNLALIAIPVLGGLAAGLVKSVKEGQEAAKVQTIYANAIANSGKISTQYVQILNDQQTALMNLGGVDDELIKTEQTRLIQMGLTGEQVAKLTPLILDMSKATGKDLLTSTIAVGKAVNGNVAGLQRFGIVIDKDKAKTDAYGATVDALSGKFGGVTKALSGSLEARLGALREGLANVREEAGIRLLPALTRIVDVAGRKLVPAFSAFMDRILPGIISGMDKFADLLENGGAEKGIKGITDALGPMVEMLKIAAAPVKAIVQAFLSLPSQVQGVLIGGFAINKLSGGLIGQGLGQVVGGLAQRGGSPANPLFVSDVAGGLGGAGVAGAAKGGLGLISKVFLVGEAIGLLALVNEVRTGISDQSTRQSVALQGTLTEFLGNQPDPKAIQNALDAVEGEIKELNSSNLPLSLVQGEALDNLKKMREELKRSLAEAGGARLTGDLGRHGPAVAITGLGTKLTALQRQLHSDLVTQTGILRTSLDPAAIAAATAQAVADIRAGAGSTDTTKGLIGDLKAQLVAAQASGNTELAGQIKDAIRQIEPFAKGRQWQQEQLAQGRRIVASNKSTADKVAALKGIQQDLLSHQRTMAAGIIQKQIDTITAIKGIKLSAATGFALTGPYSLPPTPTKPRIHIPTTSHRAAGGPVRMGLGYLVGEDGPEWFAPDENGAILPRKVVYRQADRDGERPLHVKVTSSVKDTADKTIVRSRWGQTAVQAGGG